MVRLAPILSRLLVVFAIVTLVSAEQTTQDPHFAVDNVVAETDAVHSAAPTAHSARDAQATITNPEGAMTNKVMVLLNAMMKKQAKAQAKKASPVQEHAKVAHSKPVPKAQDEDKKMTGKVMKLLSKMMKQKQMQMQKQHKVSHKKAHVKKKVVKKPKKLHIEHVKNGFQLLNNMVRKSEEAARRHQEKIEAKAKEKRDKKSAAEEAKKTAKKKVDPLQIALAEASTFLDGRATKEAKKKKEMAKSLKAAQDATNEDLQDYDSYDDELEEDEDDMPLPADEDESEVAEPAQPAPLTGKGASILASLMKQHTDKEKKREAAKMKLRKQAEAKKAAANKAAEEKAHAEMMALAAVRAKKAKAAAKAKARQDKYKKLGVHASALPHRHRAKKAHKTSHKAAQQAGTKKHISLVDQALMSMMTVDLKTSSSPPEKSKKHSQKVVEESGEDALAEEEAYGREVQRNMHREVNTKAQRKKELRDIRIKEHTAKKAEKAKRTAAMVQQTKHLEVMHGEAADKKAGKMVKHEREQLKDDVGGHQDLAASIAAKLFKQLGGKAMKPEDLRAAVASGVVQHLKAHPKVAKKVVAKKTAKKVVEKAPKVAKVVVKKAAKVVVKKAAKVVVKKAAATPKVVAPVKKVTKVAADTAQTPAKAPATAKPHVTHESLEIVKDLETAIETR